MGIKYFIIRTGELISDIPKYIGGAIRKLRRSIYKAQSKIFKPVTREHCEELAIAIKENFPRAGFGLKIGHTYRIFFKDTHLVVDIDFKNKGYPHIIMRIGSGLPFSGLPAYFLEVRQARKLKSAQKRFIKACHKVFD